MNIGKAIQGLQNTSFVNADGQTPVQQCMQLADETQKGLRRDAGAWVVATCWPEVAGCCQAAV